MLRRAFFAGLRPLVDGVLAVGTRNSEYWRTVLGAQVPQWTMPYAVDNAYFAQRAESAAGSREELRASSGWIPGARFCCSRPSWWRASAASICWRLTACCS